MDSSVLPPEERDRIVERLRLESQLRKEVNRDEDARKRTRWGWMENKLLLLVVGALGSGLLIPFLQTRHEDIKWARQNRYDNLKYRVESVRAAIRELTLAQTFVAEAFERARRQGAHSPAGSEAHRLQLVEMHNRRFQQNAKFSASLALLPRDDREAARANFNRYLSSEEQLMNVLLPETPAARPGSGSPAEKADVETSLMEDVNANYEKTLQRLNDCLARLELEGETFK